MKAGRRGDFWSHVDRSAGPDGCWPWTAARYSNGYGLTQMPSDRRRNTTAHRAAYLLTIGPVADGLVLDHLCRNRACANPAHLEPVTQAENLRRGNGPTGVHARQTHCVNGHEFAASNVYMWRGSRHCRTCRYNRNHLRAAAA